MSQYRINIGIASCSTWVVALLSTAPFQITNYDTPDCSTRMAERKRERDESDVATAVQELEAAVTRDTEIKLKALQTLSSLLDSKDEA